MNNNTIFNKINSELSKLNITLDSLIKEHIEEYENFGICRAVTYQRLKKVSQGYEALAITKTVYNKKLTINNLDKVDIFMDEIHQLIQEKEYKNYKIRLVNNELKLTVEIEDNFRVTPNPFNLKYYKAEFINNKDIDNVYEALIERTKELIQLEYMKEIDYKKMCLILNDENVENIINDCESNGVIFIPSYVLLSKKEKMLVKEKNINLIEIPDYYYLNELREAGEL